MSTQELIAASLTLADMDERVAEMPTQAAADVREACARAMAKTQKFSEGAAEVPMPEPVGWIGWIRHDEGGGRHPMFSTYEPTAYEHRDQVAAMPDVRTYGDAREAAGYARGLEAGGKDAERYRRPLAELVAVKDIKVRSDACWPGDPEIPVLMREYSTRKDAAWIEARAALLDCGDAGHDEGRCGNASCGRPAQAGLVSKVIEQRLRTWRQSRMNNSGDRLSLDDFMGPDSIDDLVDCVCDEFAIDAALRGEVK